VRLEVVNTCPAELSQFLLEQFDLPAAALYRVNGPVNLVRLNELIDQTDAPELRFPPFEPVWPERGCRAKSIFDRLRRATCCCTTLRELRAGGAVAARGGADPDVLAIKQTIYRTGAKSELMDLLIEAARAARR
jgi:polyphosphate kinase